MTFFERLAAGAVRIHRPHNETEIDILPVVLAENAPRRSVNQFMHHGQNNNGNEEDQAVLKSHIKIRTVRSKKEQHDTYEEDRDGNDTKDQVREYCEGLVTDLGMKGGFMLGPGCEVPMSAKAENVKAIFETIRG